MIRGVLKALPSDVIVARRAPKSKDGSALTIVDLFAATQPLILSPKPIVTLTPYSPESPTACAAVSKSVPES